MEAKVENRKVTSRIFGIPLTFVFDEESRGYYPKCGSDYKIEEDKIISGTSLSTKSIDTSQYIKISVFIPTPWTAANLSLYGAPTITGAFSPLRDSTGYKVEISGIVTGSWYTFPGSDGFSLPFIKLSSQNSSGVPVNQGGTRDLIFCLRG